MTETSPVLSVVLCTHNGRAKIAEQLDALAQQESVVPWELVIVDNRSTDGTADFARAHWRGSAPLHIVDANEVAGLSHARNVGVSNAAAECVAFCDDDDVVGRSWVQAMADALSEHRLVASALSYERLNDKGLLAGRARFQSEHVEELFGMPVCAGPCGVRKELWDDLGGNDESLDFTGEDFDFALRAFTEAGIRPFFASDAVYHYRLRDDPAGSFTQARAYGRSHATLWARYGGGRVGPADEIRRAAREWWWVLTRAPLAMAGRNRVLWARKAGRRIGRLSGSWRERVLLP